MDDSEYDSRFPNRQQLQELNRHHAKQGDVESQSPDYKFDNERRGVAIVIVNDKFQGEIKSKREGCDKDMEDLQSTFASYGFEVRCFLDRSAKEVLSKLNEISKEDHSKSDCLVIAISTHGEEHVDENVREDLIFVSDKPIKTRTILELFTDDKCPSLKGKPRVVFIQACRGSNLDSGSEIRYKTTKKTSYDTPDFTDCVSMRSQVRDQLDSILDASEEGSPKTIKIKTDTSLIKAVAETSSYKLGTDIKNSASPNPSHSPSYKAPCVSPAPCFKDFLVMYATPPGYYAFRRIKDGSWFITSLCKVLKEHVNSPENLLTILTKVVKHVAQEMKSITSDENLNAKKQTPVIYSRLTKSIFLNKKP